MIHRIEATIEQIKHLVSELETLGAGKRLMNAVNRLAVVKKTIEHSETQGKTAPDQLLIEEMEIQSQIAELETLRKAEQLFIRHLARTATRLQKFHGNKTSEGERIGMLSSKSSGTSLIRLIGTVKYKKPRAFEIDGSERVQVRTWKEMLVKASRFLLTKHGCYKHCPVGFFSESPEGLSRPRKILDGVYVNAEKNSEMIVDFLEKLLNALNRPPSSLIIYTE